MKKFWSLTCLLLLGSVLLVSMVVGCSKPAPEQTFNLKFGHQYAVGHNHDEDAQWIASEVAKRTQNKVAIEVYPANTLVKVKVAYEEVAAGRVDMLMTFPGYYYGMAPLSSVMGMPFIFEPGAYVGFGEALKAGVHKILNEYLTKDDVVLLAHLPSGGQHFFTNKPIKVKEDLDNFLIRSPSGFQSESLKLLGAVPVDIASTAEVYTAIQRGTVDGCMTSVGTATSNKLWEVGGYATEVNLNIGFMQVLTNGTVFGKLPKDYQKVIKEVCLERQDWKASNIGAMERGWFDKYASNGVEVLALTPEEWRRWAPITRPALNGFLALDPKAQEMIDIALKYSSVK
ncbi:TRAP transporter substrate-binding protein [Chloroflexota bacterium]